MRELIKIDLARGIVHQQADSWKSLMFSDDQVSALLQAGGISRIKRDRQRDEPARRTGRR